jgi:hypothetical protein
LAWSGRSPDSTGCCVAYESSTRDQAVHDRAGVTQRDPQAAVSREPEAVYERSSLWLSIRLARLLAPWAEQLFKPRLMRKLGAYQMVATEMTHEQAVRRSPARRPPPGSASR